MQVLSTLLLIILTLSIERSLYRIIYNYQESERKSFVASVFTGSILITGGLSALSLLLEEVFVLAFPSIPFYPYYALVIASILPVTIITVFKAYAQVTERPLRFTVATSLHLLLLAGFMLYFVIGRGMGAYGYLLGSLIGSVLISIPLAAAMLLDVGLSFRVRFLKPALLFSIPIMPTLLSSFVLNLSDRVFIDNYFSLSELGVYSLGSKLASVIKIAGSSFLMAYVPLFYRLANTKSKEEASGELKLYGTFFVCILAVITLSLYLFSAPILELLFPPEYQGALPYLRFFCVSMAVGQFCGLLNVMIYQAEKTHLVSLIVVIAAVANVILNYTMLPVYGAIAAVWTSLICNVVIVMLTFCQARKYYYVDLPWSSIASFLICLGLVVAFVANVETLDWKYFMVWVLMLAGVGGVVWRTVKQIGLKSAGKTTA